MNTRLVLSGLVLSLLVAGCSGRPPASSATGSGSRTASATTDVASPDVSGLRDAFAASGFEATASGPATGGVLPSRAQFLPLLVDGARVQVYHFASSQAVSEWASSMHADGFGFEAQSSVQGQSGFAEFEWRGRPHFFKRDRLVVLYLSNQRSSVESTLDAGILRVLQQQMGPQFAGG
jgi:hypothetical protein